MRMFRRYFRTTGTDLRAFAGTGTSSLDRDKQTETVFSFVSNLTTLEMRLAPHNPCEGFLSIKPFDLL